MYTRVHRLFRIVTLIQSAPGWTAPRLASACQVDVRTIFRDMKELQGAGIPIKFDRSVGGFRLPRDYFLPPIQLTVDEALALTTITEMVAKPGGIPYLESAERAMSKVGAALPSGVRDDVDRLMGQTEFRPAHAEASDVAADVYAMVRAATAQRQELACAYESPDAQREEFILRPYSVFFGVRAWYVAGWHSGRKAVRTLRLSRFAKVSPTDVTFPKPPRFSLENYLGNAWRMIRGEEDHQIELIFRPQIASTIAETVWHRTQELEFLDGGELRFRATVSGLDEIVWWILSMGPSCKVITPGALAKRVADLAAQTAAIYAEETSGVPTPIPMANIQRERF
jgi:predicted DNA-binding transcriptional regulator YafY